MTNFLDPETVQQLIEQGITFCFHSRAELTYRTLHIRHR